MRRFNPINLLAGLVASCSLISAAAHGQVIVRMETGLGNIDIELRDEEAPVTVENFLNYVNSNRYDGTFIHRSVPGFVIQGGGYYSTATSIEVVTKDDPVVNEFDPSRSNLRGTIAMAKLPGNPDSATSEWFFNLADNSASLDSENGGYTVFGQVIGAGMDVVDAIAALTVVNCGGNFTELPVIDLATCPTISEFDHLATVSSARVILRVAGNQAVVEDIAGNLVGITAIAPATLSNVEAIANPSPNDAPAGVAFREGFFSFQIDGVTPGGSTSVALQLPAGYVPNTYYMYGPTPDNHTPHWYEFNFNGETGAEFFGNNFVVLNFVDGGRGDADLTANGQISDPGAPGITTIATDTSDGSGGGCTLSTDSNRSSVPVDFWLIALALAGFRWYRASTKAAWQTAKMS